MLFNWEIQLKVDVLQDPLTNLSFTKAQLLDCSAEHMLLFLQKQDFPGSFLATFATLLLEFSFMHVTSDLHLIFLIKYR